MPINLAVEGPTDEAVLLRVLKRVGMEDVLPRRHGGKPYLLSRLSKFNEAASFANWLIVIDLDQDAHCAPDFIQAKLPNPSQGMLLRVPVRAIESWILADRERFAQFLNISVANIPQNPDLEPYPKTKLINLARKSRKTLLRKDMVPDLNSGRSVGPGYLTRITEFMELWRPEVAAQNSDSLRRCIEALQNWKMIGA